MLEPKRLSVVFLPLLLAIRCGGSTEPGADAGSDASPADAGKDVTTPDGGKDAAPDATLDSPADSPADAPADVTLDSPADAPVDVDAGAIASISGLVLWLDAGKGVTTNGAAITAWADQSTQGNNAVPGAAGPTFVASSIASLPAAHFVAASAQFVTIADAASLQFGTGDYTVAVVAKFDNNPSGGPTTGIGALYTKYGPQSGLLFLGNDIDFKNPQQVVAGLCNLENATTEVQYASAYNDGTARLYEVQRASGTEVLRVGGSQVASSTSSVDVSEPGSPVEIGYMSGAPGAALDGDVAEVIAVKGTLASADLATIESYLKSKYAL